MKRSLPGSSLRRVASENFTRKLNWSTCPQRARVTPEVSLDACHQSIEPCSLRRRKLGTSACMSELFTSGGWSRRRSGVCTLFAVWVLVSLSGSVFVIAIYRNIRGDRE